MADPIFRGSGVALITPFGEDGVNRETIGELVDFHHSEGTDALVVCGSTGEAVTMTPEEQFVVIATAAESAGGRMPVIAGVGGSDTRAVSELGRRAREAGADALLLAPPPYNKPSQAGIAEHFRRVVQAADLPVMLYNVPGRTACNALPETIAGVVDEIPVIGVKEASGDLSQIAELARLLDGRVPIYSGNDDQTLAVLALGGAGVVSVLGNIAPRDTSRMVHAFHEGALDEARSLQLGYLPLIRMLFADPNPSPVKTGVAELGFDVGTVRLPLLPLTPDRRERLAQQMRAHRLAAGVRS